jgi:hypothetical protein
MVAIGALSHDWNRAARPQQPKVDTFTERETVVVGHVLRSGLVRERGNDRTQTLDLVTEEVDGQAVTIGIRVTVYSDAGDAMFGARNGCNSEIASRFLHGCANRGISATLEPWTIADIWRSAGFGCWRQ